jgi:typhoid toxin secretion A
VNITQIIDEIIAREGGYVDHLDDQGGPTNFGISLRLYVKYHPNANRASIAKITRAEAFSIYYQEFYKLTNIYKLTPISEAIATEVLDSAVNFGPTSAIHFLQRALNVFNMQQQVYPDVAVTNTITEPTIRGLSAFMNKRGAEGEQVLLKALNALQAVKYIELAESKQKSESFVYGWIRARVNM